MEFGAKHRLLLSLRSEKALGLRSIARGNADFSVCTEEFEEPQIAAPRGDAANVALRPSPAPPRLMRSAPQPSPASAEAYGESVKAKNLISLSTDAPFDAPLLSTDEKRSRLLALEEKEVRTCPKCRLCETRTQTVFGEGDVDAKIFFIGEGPGENEDLTGRPFVGRAGQLLDKMIAAMGLRRNQVYIANIVKCRPPENRVPAPDEVATCTPYLERQLEMIRPATIVTLGRPAASYMLGNPKLTMGSVRGRWFQWRGIKLMPTYHPSYVLRNYTEETRKAVWNDLKLVMDELGMTTPARGKPM